MAAIEVYITRWNPCQINAKVETAGAESAADDGRLIGHGELIVGRPVALALPREEHERAAGEQIAEEDQPGEDEREAVADLGLLREDPVVALAAVVPRRQQHLDHHHHARACNKSNPQHILITRSTK